MSDETLPSAWTDEGIVVKLGTRRIHLSAGKATLNDGEAVPALQFSPLKIPWEKGKAPDLDLMLPKVLITFGSLESVETVRGWLAQVEQIITGKPTEDPAEQLRRVRALVTEWVGKQGHDRCWYYPDIFGKIAGVLGVELPKDLGLPPLPEFEDGCRRYQAEQYGPGARITPTKPLKVLRDDPNTCHAGRDGDCYWQRCPQLRDGEPKKSGRSCPLWRREEDEA
jgi:hypothetical protein